MLSIPGTPPTATTSAGGVRWPAFIDFVNLDDSPEHPRPEEFPPIGSMLDSTALDVMTSGELRLTARPSALARRRLRGPSAGDTTRAAP